MMSTTNERQLTQNYLELLSAAYGEELARVICTVHGVELDAMNMIEDKDNLAA